MKFIYIYILCVAAIWFAWLMLLMNLFYLILFHLIFFIFFLLLSDGERQLNREIDSEGEGNSKRFRFMAAIYVKAVILSHMPANSSYSLSLLSSFLDFSFGFWWLLLLLLLLSFGFWYRCCWCRNNSSIDKNHLHLFRFLWWRSLVALCAIVYRLLFRFCCFIICRSDCSFAWKCRLNHNKCHHQHATNLMVKINQTLI